MSARIPDTMLLSDLLKPTGYDCPEEFLGKTFEEATTGGSDIQTNKAATVDVSAYTEPIEIKPDTGYTATKKVTLTLSNIPVAGVTLTAWKADTAVIYTKTAEPTTSDKALVPATTGLSEAVIAAVADEFASITIGETVYSRYSDGDQVL